MSSPPLRSLRARLAPRTRRELAARLAGGAPGRSPVPNATPFVSAYAAGKLVGLAAGETGSARARLERAIARALDGATPGRGRVALEVAYPRTLERIRMNQAAERVELGVTGLCWDPPSGDLVVVLPNVARDERLDVSGLLGLIARRAEVAPGGLDRGRLWCFETDWTAASSPAMPRAQARRTAHDLAARFLAKRVGPDGAVEYGLDPQTRERFPRGDFYHARAAVVIAALVRHGGHQRVAARALRFLERELERALGGQPVPNWPTHACRVAGTLAMAARAGAGVRAELRAIAARVDFSDMPWHAAQLVSVLGHDGTTALWRACVDHLSVDPWAPWTLIAARALGAADIIERVELTLVNALRRAPPYLGGVTFASIPELPLSALTAEALADSRRAATQSAATLARDFVLCHQFVPDAIPAALDPKLALGGFPMSTCDPRLRTDVTAHALLAG